MRLKSIFILFGFVFSSLLSAQITDDFNDGDFTSNPTWSGDAGEFMINSTKQLQLNNIIAGTSYLSTPTGFSSLNDLEWDFYIKLGFSPSSNNYSRVYLTSNAVNLEGSLNGYYLQFGEALSNDAIELFKQSGTSVSSIARGAEAGIASSFAIRVKVTRDASGLWKLWADHTGGYNYILEASGIDNTYQSSSFFGPVCEYTSSNSGKFYFDDLYIGPVLVDNIIPTVSSLTLVSNSQLDVLFSEPIEKASAELVSNYFVNNSVGNPLSVVQDGANLNLAHLAFTNVFTNALQYKLTITNVSDLNNNSIVPTELDFVYYLTSAAVLSDIAINEILFDPKEGGIDFVEIFNRSNKIINLKDLIISEQDTMTNVLTDKANISGSDHLLFPAEYLVLTKDPEAIKDQYLIKDLQAFLTVPSLPSMNVDGDVVVISDKSENIIDKVVYTSDMHFSLLSETKGISLERLNFNRPSGDKSNWHSAAEDAGFATPGYKNSQYSEAIGDEGEVTISPGIFSPDNDGNNDVVNINYKFDEPGFVANIKIYDTRGRLAKNLVRNELLGTSGTFSWDGTDEERQKGRIGIYIIYFEAFNAVGKVKKIKKTCVLAGDLN